MVSRKISFKANEVSYQEPNDGDIIQIIFNEEASKSQSDNADKISRLYFLISQCYDFPGKPSTEWFDGADFDGGAEVKEYIFTETSFEIRLNNGFLFSIEHACSKKVFKKINSFLKHEFSSQKLSKQ